MRIQIHRGAEQIGGNCVEVESRGKRIVLDVGLPLHAETGADVALPDVAGLADGDGQVVGLFLTHGHADHWGLVGQVHPDVPVFMGEDACRIVREAAFFSPLGESIRTTGSLLDRVPISVGPFKVTPYLADHSAFDAYSLLVEADGERLFYTGDLRGHGRKGILFDELTANPPERVDTLLCEGTSVRHGADRTPGPSERDVEEQMARLFAETRGMALVAFSPQNIDRLVTVFRACRRAGRTLVVDLYTDTVAWATGRGTIPRAGFPGLRVYVPQSQRVRVKESRQFSRVNRIRRQRIYPEQLAQNPGKYAVIFRASMIREFERINALSDGILLWSLWKGYLDEPSGQRVRRFATRHGMPLRHVHSSGHAHVQDLQRLVAAMKPGAVVPIHTEAPQVFAGLFGSGLVRQDGIWWDCRCQSAV